MANTDATSPPKGTNRSALIIVGTFAMLGLAYSLVRVYVLRERIANSQTDIRLLQDANSVLQSNLKELQISNLLVQEKLKSLDALQGSIADINTSLSELRGRAEQSQRHWARVEAMYLLRLAQDQLRLTGDVPTALLAMQAAATRLADSRDATSAAVRAQLDNDLKALRAVPQVDQTALYNSLQRATQQAPTLPVAGLVTDTPTASDAPLPAAGLSRAWAVLGQAMLKLVSVRKVSTDSGALITTNERLLRQRQLQLLLVSATQAVQYRNAQTYREALQQSDALLETGFDKDAASVKALRAQLEQLAQQDIAPRLPDTSRSLAMLERELPISATGSP